MYLVRGGIPGPGGYLVPGGCTWSRGVYLVPGGCTWSRGVYLVLGGVPGPRGVYLVWGGVPGPRGCTWSRGGTWFRGGVPGPGGVPCLRGVYLVPGVYLVWGGVPGPGGVPGQVLPPVNRMTNRCKNITLAKTSFRPVKMLNMFLRKIIACIFRGGGTEILSFTQVTNHWRQWQFNNRTVKLAY